MRDSALFHKCLETNYQSEIRGYADRLAYLYLSIDTVLGLYACITAAIGSGPPAIITEMVSRLGKAECQYITSQLLLLDFNIVTRERPSRYLNHNIAPFMLTICTWRLTLMASPHARGDHGQRPPSTKSCAIRPTRQAGEDVEGVTCLLGSDSPWSSSILCLRLVIWAGV
jgi:hypothetical protein